MTEHEPFALSAEMIDEAIVDLHSIHDWLRFAVSQFNAADLYFGHGTDNAWDEAAVMLSHVLYLPPLRDEKLFGVRLTLDARGYRGLAALANVVDQVMGSA